MVRELSDEEKEELAREIAADKYAGCYDQSGQRRAFCEGWNAAMAHVEEQRVSSCTADMEVKVEGG